MRTFTFFKAAFFSAFLFLSFNMVSVAQTPFFEDFEAAGWAGTGYAQRNVTDPLGAWIVAGVGTMDGNDRYIGTRSIRLRGNPQDGNMRVEMNFDKSNGIGEASFYYASYSSHSGGKIVLYYSIDGGNTWIEGGSVIAPSWNDAGEMLKATFAINIPGNIRVKVARTGGLANYTSVNIDNLSLTDFVCENCVKMPTITPSETYHCEPFIATITCATEGAVIRYTTNGSEPTETSELYTEPIPVSAETTLKAKAWKGAMEPSPIGAANYIFLDGISTLAELRAKYQGTVTPVLMFTGEAILTQIQDYNKVKYIQDETAAIMLFNSGKLTGLVGDKVTNICGTLNAYFGMLQLTPVQNGKVISSFNTVPAEIITASQLNADENNPIQAKVVTIKDVLYVQSGNFGTGRYYDLTENGTKYDSVVYTDKYEADYIGTAIPTAMVNITGVINFKGSLGFRTMNRIIPLDKDNHIVNTIAEINKSVIKLAPNPANSYVNIITESPMKLEMYTILGNRIHSETLYEGSNIISVSRYPSGIYIMKLTDIKTGQAFVQKLVVQ
jgi:hypothetical protein